MIWIVVRLPRYILGNPEKLVYSIANQLNIKNSDFNCKPINNNHWNFFLYSEENVPVAFEKAFVEL